MIVLALGNPSVLLYMKNISEFKRKPIEKISNIENAEELIEPVRIAPSSTNSQSWGFFYEVIKV